MNTTPPLDLEHTRRQQVSEADSIRLGAAADGQAAVFSTPAMILMMELAAKELLAPYLEADEESVGSTVDIAHTAPTPLGAEVSATARLVGVDKKSFTFEVRARDAAGEIGRGIHKRAVVRMGRLRKLLTERHPAAPAVSEVRKPAAQHFLLSETRDGVMTVSFNRPEKRNAIHRPLTGEWERLLDDLESGASGVRMVSLTGKGRAFCAGEDIRENADFTPEESVREAARRASVCERLSQLPLPVLALVNGPCFGGGLMLALACDHIIASHHATFGLPEVKLGWPPAYFIDRLAARTGRARAFRMAAMGETLSAAQALEAGLIDRTVPANRLDIEGDAFAEAVRKLPAAAVAGTKRLLAGPADTATNLEAYLRCRARPEAMEGIRGFLTPE